MLVPWHGRNVRIRAYRNVYVIRGIESNLTICTHLIFIWNWKGSEKTLASDGHVVPKPPKILGVINWDTTTEWNNFQARRNFRYQSPWISSKRMPRSFLLPFPAAPNFKKALRSKSRTASSTFSPLHQGTGSTSHEAQNSRDMMTFSETD